LCRYNFFFVEKNIGKWRDRGCLGGDEGYFLGVGGDYGGDGRDQVHNEMYQLGDARR
jgi:hypothetical protein